MTNRPERNRSQYVRQMFARIAERYDLLNRLMTFGQDRVWRRIAVQRLRLESNSLVLDIGSGTGDLAFETLRQQPDAQVVAADFTPEMLHVGKSRSGEDKLQWVIADSRHLPFASDRFDGLVSGFLLRNVTNLPQALLEQVRVLKPGGRWVSLETTPPAANWLRPLLRLHLRWVIPALGRWVAGDPEAYRYLPNTTEAFLTADALSDSLRQAGLVQVAFQRRMLGTIAIHWGVLPDDSPSGAMVD
jgi:demethylmenaquinone methyltransferase/2-methoxy-6-polyprenyl-1,4-benzoquinol methylase